MPQTLAPKRRKTRVVSFTTNKADRVLLDKIVDRAMDKFGREMGIERKELDMDLTACHCNGCPLDLAKLADADNLSFTHDVLGIRRFIDRTTGAVDERFCPRFCLKQD